MGKVQKIQVEEYNPGNCKHCSSNHIVRFGHTRHGNGQRMLCRDCGRTFMKSDTLPSMRTPAEQIASALGMYYEGMSLNAIRSCIRRDTGNCPSDSTIYEWTEKFSKIAVKETARYRPQIGDTWICDETYLRVDQSNVDLANPNCKNSKAKWLLLWDCIDADTHFLLASHITATRGQEDAQELIEKAFLRAGKYPKVVNVDRLSNFFKELKSTYYSENRQGSKEPFRLEDSSAMVDVMRSMMKQRTKDTRVLKNRETAQRYIDAWQVHYNFIRRQEDLDNCTPAQKAGIEYSCKSWLQIIQTPNIIKEILKPSKGQLKLEKSSPCESEYLRSPAVTPKVKENRHTIRQTSEVKPVKV